MLDDFYSVEPPPWSIGFGFHAFYGGFLALFVKAHLVTLEKWKQQLPKSNAPVEVESLVLVRVWVREPTYRQPP